MKRQLLRYGLTLAAACTIWAVPAEAAGLKIGVFDVDATPEVGAPMAYNPVRRVDELTLRARGIVLVGGEKPVVLCAVDWIGIANEGFDQFREALAAAAGTEAKYVALHALHQHDAPGCDFTAEKIIRDLGLKTYGRFQGDFHRKVIERCKNALAESMTQLRDVTHVGYGEAEVKEVASNRRVEIKPDGRIGRMRGSANRVPELTALPEGLIDPKLSALSFWDKDHPVAVLSYYACHPQSYYRRGVPSPDFPGIARFMRGQSMNETLHVHFNGAGGNIVAGKYNNGSEPMRMILAYRLMKGMEEAFEKTQKVEVQGEDVKWKVEPVVLPLSAELDEKTLLDVIHSAPERGYISAVDQLAFMRRHQVKPEIEVSCLQVGDIQVLHLPGELFVEYQLAAKKMKPDQKVMMAAYGEYGPGYIGTKAAYAEGGYEVSASSSAVGPESEAILLEAIRKLLD